MAESWPAVGVRFFTTDDILITHYLVNKIMGNHLPLEGVMIEADLYGQQAVVPWLLFQNADARWETRVDPSGKLITSESVRYVFTRLTKVGKGTGNKQKSRVSGCGCWHGNSVEAVEDEDGNKVGTKKTFKYKPNNSNVNCPADTAWIMHEYSAPGCDDFVLCKIKMIKRQKRNRGMEDGVRELGKRSRSDHQLVQAVDFDADPVVPTAVPHEHFQGSETLIQPAGIIDLEGGSDSSFQPAVMIEQQYCPSFEDQSTMEDMDVQQFLVDALSFDF